MCFEEHAVITKQSIDIPGIAFLINAFGGFETIDEQRIGFIESVNEEPPHHAEAEVRAGAGAEPSSSTQSISIAQARMLLPYLYLLEDSQSVETEEETNDEINFAQTRAAINLVESVLSETGVDESDGSMEEDEENISFDTIESTHVLTVPAVSAAVTAAAPTTSKKTISKEEALAIQRARKDKLQEESTAKKLRKLEGIRAHFRGKAAKFRHYNLEETQKMLSRLYIALSHHGIHATGESRTRGDHHSFETTAASTGHSASVGLVLRGREGFQSGTVKKIIDDHVDNALLLLKLMLRK